jgi:hypothetical protein
MPADDKRRARLNLIRHLIGSVPTRLPIARILGNRRRKNGPPTPVSLGKTHLDR